MSIPTKIIPFPNRPRSPAMETVTFRRPFVLPGLERPHRPGTYAVRETRTQIDVSWPAFVLSLGLVLIDGAFTQILDVSRKDLDDALMRDLAAGAP